MLLPSLSALSLNPRNPPTGVQITPDERERWLTIVAEDASNVVEAPPRVRADREVVLAAVKEKGIALHWASKKLRADREVVLTAVKENGEALLYASEELRADREVVLAAVNENGEALRFASEELRADREVVLTAVKENGEALLYASEKLEENFAILFAAATADREPQTDAIKRVLVTIQGWIKKVLPDKNLPPRGSDDRADAVARAMKVIDCKWFESTQEKLVSIVKAIDRELAHLEEDGMIGVDVDILKKHKKLQSLRDRIEYDLIAPLANPLRNPCDEAAFVQDVGGAATRDEPETEAEPKPDPKRQRTAAAVEALFEMAARIRARR